MNTCTSARQVIALKPDAIGLNFYPPSPRCVAVDTAADILEFLPVDISAVGLFVNHSAAEIIEHCKILELSTIQLHGDEPPELMSELLNAIPDLKIIRAWRMGADGLASLRIYLEQTARLRVPLTACLIDSQVKGVYGGSGTVVAWDMLNREYAREDWPPLILAGGLNPQNIGDAITAVHPFGVDTASGVESSVGQKDFALVGTFIKQARSVAIPEN